MDPATSYAWSVADFYNDDAAGAVPSALELVYGVSTSTSLSNGEYLVLKANQLNAGTNYVFRMTATNSNGLSAYASINITAGLPPTGGVFNVEPSNGTALGTTFSIRTANWTNEYSSYPLTYTFIYFDSSLTEISMRSETPISNFSTTLPLGYAGTTARVGYNEYDLVVGVVAYDNIGASGDLNVTVNVALPPLNEAVGLARKQASAAEDLAESGDPESAAFLVQQSALVLNEVLGNSAGNSSAATAARSKFIDVMSSVISQSTTTSAVGGSAACLKMLTDDAGTLSEDDKSSVFDHVVDLVDNSDILSEITPSAQIAVMETVSNLLTAGILKSSSSSSSPSSTRSTLDSSLLTLNSVITASLVPGEEAVELVTENIGSSNLKIDQQLLTTFGALGIDAAMATGAPGARTTSFVLPDSILTKASSNSRRNRRKLLDSTVDEVSIAVVSWSENPYESESVGAVQNGSIVTSLALNGFDVTGLEDPITIYLPLPTSASALIESDPVEWTFDCGLNVSLYDTYVSAMDYDRQEYCAEHYGEVVEDDNMTWFNTSFDYSSTQWQRGKRTAVARNYSGLFVCDEINKTYVPECGGRSSGFLNFSCPTQYSSADCTFWDDDTSTWSSYDCTLWTVSYESGYAVCNCTHLTNFAAQQLDTFRDNSDILLSTSASAADLQLSDVRKNLGILILLLCLWILCFTLSAADWLAGRIQMATQCLQSDLDEKLRAAGVLAGRSAGPVNGMRESLIPVKLEDCFAQGDSALITKQIDEVRETLKDQKRTTSILKRWFHVSYVDSPYVSPFIPTNYGAGIASKRGVYLLSEVLLFLFITCLSAPELYLCEEQNIGAIPEGLFFEFPEVESWAEFLNVARAIVVSFGFLGFFMHEEGTILMQVMTSLYIFFLTYSSLLSTFHNNRASVGKCWSIYLLRCLGNAVIFYGHLVL